MSNVTIVVGAQWGDEGKGKWIDILAERSEYVARYQGGNNAGHTLYIDGQKTVLHQVPSGVFRPKQVCVLAAGVVVNPQQLVDEIQGVKKSVELQADRLWLSARSHVISPWHIRLDRQSEESESTPIGTTRRGIGPTYAHKASRIGLRLGDFINDQKRNAWLEALKKRFPEVEASLKEDQQAWHAFHEAAKYLSPFVNDAETKLRQKIYDGRPVLLEGAQGALLDIDHGTYPYVTSSATAAGGALQSIGFSPKHVGHIYGVAKAYVTRVGEGPMPTELFDEAGHHLASKGKEFGATTGRPRRCGWLDAVALRYSRMANGFDGVILNKLDILSGLDEIKIAVAYEHPRLGKLDDFPWDRDILAECKPIYKSYKGWPDEIPQSGFMKQLSPEVQTYIKGVEEAIFAKIPFVGTGVERQHYLQP